MQKAIPSYFVAVCSALVFLSVGCDALEPVERDMVVVEAFIETDKPLSPITIRRTRPLDARYPLDAGTAITEAEVVFRANGMTVPYFADPARPGRYLPALDGHSRIAGRTGFSVEVRWQSERATAESVVPPAISIDRIDIDVPDRPIPAVFADSLSLNLREGFLYPVEVTIWWETNFIETGADSAYWVRAKLSPPATFPSAVVGFFLRTEQILREKHLEKHGNGRRKWVGVYGVPVESDTSPLPAHELDIALLRGTQDYAQYAASRQAPEQREPVSNVRGGVGIVAGVSYDRRALEIYPD